LVVSSPNQRSTGLSQGLEVGVKWTMNLGCAAQQLGIGRSLFYKLLADGQVESIHVGRLRRIPIDALATYIDRQGWNTRDSANRAARASSETGRRAS
jgi:excisionase family DNA binding protein